MASRYTTDFISEVLAYLDTHLVRQTCQTYGVYHSTLYAWLRKYNRRDLKKHYTPQRRVELVSRAAEIGVAATAAESGASETAINTWNVEMQMFSKRRTYTDDFRRYVLERACEYGVLTVAREMKVQPSLIYKWDNIFHILPRTGKKAPHIRYKTNQHIYSVAERNEILEYALGHTMSQTMQKYGVAASTVRKWAALYGLEISKCIPYNVRAAAVEYAMAHNMSQAARKYCVSTTTISNWCDEFGCRRGARG